MRETARVELVALLTHLNGLVTNYRSGSSSGLSVTLARIADDHENTARVIEAVLTQDASADAAEEQAGGYDVLDRLRQSTRSRFEYKKTGRVASIAVPAPAPQAPVIGAPSDDNGGTGYLGAGP